MSLSSPPAFLILKRLNAGCPRKNATMFRPIPTTLGRFYGTPCLPLENWIQTNVANLKKFSQPHKTKFQKHL